MLEKKVRAAAIILVIIIVIAFAVTGAGSFMAQMHKNLLNEPAAKVELSQIKDGSYTGSCKVFPVSAEVRVFVENHQITAIELLKHRNGRGDPVEIITSKVVEAQSLEVDTITGATLSSKVILKAIENALSAAR